MARTSKQPPVKIERGEPVESKYTSKRALAQRAAAKDKRAADEKARTAALVREQQLREDRRNAGVPADPDKAARNKESNRTLFSFRLSPADLARLEGVLSACDEHSKKKGRPKVTRSRLARVAVEYLLNSFGATKRDRELWLKELVAA